jgi:hypothetical protein
MANRIERTRLQSGLRHIIYHYYFESDGASGDIDSYALLDIDDEDMGTNTRFIVEDVTYAFNGFSGRLHFELLVDDTLIWVLPPATGNHVNFEPYSGLRDRSGGDGTGKLLFSTTGLDTDGDAGSMLIKVRLGA